MVERSSKVRLGGEGASLRLEFEGSPCRCEDFQMAVMRFAKEWKAALPKERIAKPCKERKIAR